MKKYRIKLVALFVAVALMLPSFTGAGALVENEAISLPNQVMMEQMYKQGPAMAAYEAIMEAWLENDEYKYPDAFGGFYHTDDFKLAIKVVENNEPFIQEITDILGDTSNVCFVETDISLRELLCLKEDVLQSFNANSVVGVGISQKESCVHVKVKDTFEYTLVENRSPLDYNHIKVEIVSSVPKMQAITYNPGKIISESKDSKDVVGTLGWYGSFYYNTDYPSPCFLTAGHVLLNFKRDGANMFFGSSKVFPSDYYTDTDYCVYESGNQETSTGWPKGTSYGDYAALACNTTLGTTEINRSNKVQMDGYTVTITDYFGSSLLNKIFNNQFDPLDRASIVDYCTNQGFLPDDTKVAKGVGIGGNTASYGVVKNQFADGDYNNGGSSWGTIKGCIEILPLNEEKPFSLGGDSGCPVYYVSGVNGKTSLLGIISMGDDTGEKNYATYITPTTILLEKGFIPYVG